MRFPSGSRLRRAPLLSHLFATALAVSAFLNLNAAGVTTPGPPEQGAGQRAPWTAEFVFEPTMPLLPTRESCEQFRQSWLRALELMRRNKDGCNKATLQEHSSAIMENRLPSATALECANCWPWRSPCGSTGSGAEVFSQFTRCLRFDEEVACHQFSWQDDVNRCFETASIATGTEETGKSERPNDPNTAATKPPTAGTPLAPGRSTDASASRSDTRKDGEPKGRRAGSGDSGGRADEWAEWKALRDWHALVTLIRTDELRALNGEKEQASARLGETVARAEESRQALSQALKAAAHAQAAATQSSVDALPVFDFGAPAATPPSDRHVFPDEDTLNGFLALGDASIRDEVHRIEVALDEAPQVLSGDALVSFRVHATAARVVLESMQSLLEGLGHVLTVRDVATAETPEERDAAFAAALVRLVEDLAEERASAFAARVFGKSVAMGLQSASAFVTSSLPESTAAPWLDESPRNVVQNTAYSLAARQQALAAWWRSYRSNGANWNRTQKQWLIEATDMLSRETKSLQRDPQLRRR